MHPRQTHDTNEIAAIDVGFIEKRSTDSEGVRHLPPFPSPITLSQVHPTYPRESS
jgi:hypothetical protein